MNNNIWVGFGRIKTIKTVTIKDSFKGDYKVTDIILVVDRNVKGNIKTTIVPLEAWGNLSEACKDFQEGDKISVEGRFTNKHWKNKNKEEMTKNLIVVEKVEKL